MNRPQAFVSSLAFAALVLAGSAAISFADDRRACLSKPEQRAAISNGQAVPLAQAIRSARSVRSGKKSRGSREVIKAELCREPKGGLVYVLTVLSRDGKVTHNSVEANSGKVVDIR